MGLRNGEYAGRKIWDGHWTNCGPEQHDGTYIIPNYNILRLLGTSWLSCFMLDNGTIETVEEIQEMLCVVRAQGCMMVENPMVTDGSAQCHIAPRWPGTSTMALRPIMFLPLLVRLNPASSINIHSCRVSQPSNSNMFCKNMFWVHVYSKQ